MASLFCIFAIALLPNYLYLRNSGEFMSLDDVAKTQLSAPSGELSIYGTGLHDDSFFYKKSLVVAKNPEIAIIGSSRTMQFRGCFFTDNYLCLGGSMSSFNEGWCMIKNLKKTSPNIKILIIGVDFWWFHGKLGNTFRHEQPARLTLKKILAPFSWLIDRKVTLKKYLYEIVSFSTNSPELIGVMARTRNSGYGQDGSYYYSDKELGSRAVMKQIAHTRKYVNTGYVRFSHADHYDKNRFDKFMQILEFLDKNEIKTIVILTPVAPSVVAEMHKLRENFAYIPEFKRELERRNIRFFDFIDPTSIGATDSEFYDGIHASESTCAKMLDSISKSGRAPELEKYLNHEEIDRYRLHPEIINSLPYKRPDLFP